MKQKQLLRFARSRQIERKKGNWANFRYLNSKQDTFTHLRVYQFYSIKCFSHRECFVMRCAKIPPKNGDKTRNVSRDFRFHIDSSHWLHYDCVTWKEMFKVNGNPLCEKISHKRISQGLFYIICVFLRNIFIYNPMPIQVFRWNHVLKGVSLCCYSKVVYEW